MWDEERVQELIEFQQQHGHCEVPHDCEDEYENLSAWIRQVRSSYFNASCMNDDDDDNTETEIDLTDGCFVDLQNLGLDLYLLRPVQRGKRRLRELLAYKRLYGRHYRAGASNSADFPKLTEWLKNLGAAHASRQKEEEIPILMDVQLSQLEKIGYDFNDSPQLDDDKPGVARASQDERWNRRVDELKEFKRIHGHFDVPYNKVEHDALYRWICECRRNYKKFANGEKSGRMTGDNLKQLKEIGFNLMKDRRVINRTNNWDQRVEELKKFKDTYGHFQVGLKGEHKSLGTWLKNCGYDFNRISRGEKSNRGLTEERIQSLRAIGFEFTDSGQKNWKNWEQRAKELKKFKDTYGHFRVRVNGEHKSLGEWVCQCRRDFNGISRGEKAKTLTEERIQSLRAIGFGFTDSSREHWWDQRVDELKKFKDTYGHFRVGVNGEHKSLGMWLEACRSDFNKISRGEKAKKLTEERIQSLQAIGFDFTDSSREHWWDQRVDELKKFKDTYGHFRVGRDGEHKSLGMWLHDCRSDFNRISRGEKAKKLTEERIQLLQAIGFDFTDFTREHCSWDQRVDELKKFKDTYGHFRVGKKGEYKSLGKWLQNCRCDFNRISRGEKTQRGLTEERMQSLRAIGYEFMDSTNRGSNPIEPNKTTESTNSEVLSNNLGINYSTDKTLSATLTTTTL